MMRLGEFAEAVRSYCDSTSGSITSWIRTRQHNDAVGGCPESPHLTAFGADVVYDAPGHPAARKELAAYFGLVLIVEGDHDHLQPAGYPACRRRPSSGIPT
jgi:hypothetical protein